MPRKIAHDDGFEISFSHQGEQLTIYDNVEVADSSQAEPSKTTAHVGNFAGALNKVMVQRKTSTDLLMIQLFIVRGFDFPSGNAVQFALHVVTASGDKEQVPPGAISKKRHDKKPKDPTGFAWFAVQGSEAPTGTVLVSVTRGTEDEDTRVFTPLSGGSNEPYIVQIEWRSIDGGAKRRVTRGMQNGSFTPPPVSRKRPVKTTKPTATKGIEHSGSPSSADKPKELTRAERSSELVSQGNKDSDIEPTVQSTAHSQKQSAGGADSNQEPILPFASETKTMEPTCCNLRMLQAVPEPMSSPHRQPLPTLECQKIQSSGPRQPWHMSPTTLEHQLGNAAQAKLSDTIARRT